MEDLNNMLIKYPALTCCKADIEKAYLMIKETFANGGKVLVCGNGGSAADSEHIVGELMKGFMQPRKMPDTMREKFNKGCANAEYLCYNLQGALPAISLVSHTSLMTAFSNDVAPDMVFAQQVFGYAKPGDCFIGLSTSGNSQNVILAADVAKVMDAKTIAFTGRTGGKLAGACDVTIKAPSDSTPEIQEYHLPIYHTICMMVERDFFVLRNDDL